MQTDLRFDAWDIAQMAGGQYFDRILKRTKIRTGESALDITIMGFKINSIKSPLIDSEFEKNGEFLHLSIDADLITPAFLSEMRSISEKEARLSAQSIEGLSAEDKKIRDAEQMDVTAQTAGYMANILTRVIKKWDAEDENGGTIPVNLETFSNLPVNFLGELFAHCMSAISPKKTTDETSEDITLEAVN